MLKKIFLVVSFLSLLTSANADGEISLHKAHTLEKLNKGKIVSLEEAKRMKAERDRIKAQRLKEEALEKQRLALLEKQRKEKAEKQRKARLAKAKAEKERKARLAKAKAEKERKARLAKIRKQILSGKLSILTLNKPNFFEKHQFSSFYTFIDAYLKAKLNSIEKQKAKDTILFNFKKVPNFEYERFVKKNKREINKKILKDVKKHFTKDLKQLDLEYPFDLYNKKELAIVAKNRKKYLGK